MSVRDFLIEHGFTCEEEREPGLRSCRVLRGDELLAEHKSTIGGATFCVHAGVHTDVPHDRSLLMSWLMEEYRRDYHLYEALRQTVKMAS